MAFVSSYWHSGGVCTPGNAPSVASAVRTETFSSPSAPGGASVSASASASVFPPPVSLPAAERVPAIPQILAACLPDDLLTALTSRLPAPGSDPCAYVEEIRLRAGRCVSFTVGGRNILTPLTCTSARLTDILASLCGGSLYAYSQDVAEGFVTLPGGIRVGVSGRAACEGGRVLGVREITGLCIRLPHRHADVGGSLCELLRRTAASGETRGLLIYAPPGVGKTTLLRGMARHLASPPDPWRTVVIDTRGELSFDTRSEGLCLDVLSGYPRAVGVSIATRTLNAQVMICDEIGDCDEAMALVSAHHGGVPLVASAHGCDVSELLARTGLRLLHEARLFSHYVRIVRDGAGGFTYRITPWKDADALL